MFRFHTAPKEVENTTYGDKSARHPYLETSTRAMHLSRHRSYFKSIGYRGARIPELPFDETRGTIPAQSGPGDRRVRPDGSGRIRLRLDQREGPEETIGSNQVLRRGDS